MDSGWGQIVSHHSSTHEAGRTFGIPVAHLGDTTMPLSAQSSELGVYVLAEPVGKFARASGFFVLLFVGWFFVVFFWGG